MAKRRPNGDGLIRKRADGRWEARIVAGHKNDGSTIYKSYTGKTQREVMRKLHELKEIYRGVGADRGLLHDTRRVAGQVDERI